jgi:GntR family transcriptional repressor for pyruvate dehydrogenase complex
VPDDKAIWGDLTTGRARVADLVFGHLARAILRGMIAPGDALPGERELAERYDVSRILVREAVHKLKDLGLVRVKQGGQTIVLDPRTASDPRIMSLELELDGARAEVRRDLAEKLLTQGVVLLELASGRLGKTQLEELDEIADGLEGAKDDGRADLVVRFWLVVAQATKNELLERETRFWLDLATRAGALSSLWRIEDKTGHALYAKLVARLKKSEDAAGTFLRAIRPVLDR